MTEQTDRKHVRVVLIYFDRATRDLKLIARRPFKRFWRQDVDCCQQVEATEDTACAMLRHLRCVDATPLQLVTTFELNGLASVMTQPITYVVYKVLDEQVLSAPALLAAESTSTHPLGRLLPAAE